MTCTVTLILTAWAISRANGATFSRVKPFASTASVYVPTGRNRMVYAPVPLVCVVVATPVAVFWAVTVAPTTTAPLGSVTTPVIDPVTVCPTADVSVITQAIQQADRQRDRFLFISPPA